MTDVFLPAIKQMQAEGKSVYGPESFQDYLAKNNLPKLLTAPLISVDYLEKLSPSLKEHGLMVLRLGQSQNGRGTQFVLVKADVDSFFIRDGLSFTQTSGIGFTPEVSNVELLAYRVFPKFSEDYFVSLALASGIFNYALKTDRLIANPARGQSTFTFELRLHSSVEKIYEYRNGQVEIDSLFVGERNKEQILFIVEAKSNKYKSLAKHKLVYPIASLAKKVPLTVKIIPVYVRVITNKDELHYHILECELPDVRTNTVAIDELKPAKHTHLILSSVLNSS